MGCNDIKCKNTNFKNENLNLIQIFNLIQFKVLEKKFNSFSPNN